MLTFSNDYYQKLRDLFGELGEKESGFPLIYNARGDMDCSVLKVGCTEFDNQQVSENYTIDSDSRELVALIKVNLTKGRHIL